MNINDFFKELREGKEPKVRYNVIVNGEWVASFDDEQKAWDVAIGYQNDDSGYYGMYPNAYVETEYLDEGYDNLKESQAQEIGQEYRRLSDKYGIDFNDLVYGKDGFMKSMYPDNPDYVYFPDFNGDVIFSEKHWNELVDWAEKNKGIKLDKWEKSEDKYNDFLEESKLNEAPDDMGYLTDDEIEAQERAEFEKKLAQRKQQRDDAKQKELDRIEQEKQKELARKQAEEKGKDLYNKVKDIDFEDWFSVLVPASGKSDTVAGEIVRAFNRLDYRYFNDGDVFYEGYGRETCGSDAAYLMETTTEEIYKILEDMVRADDGEYSKGLRELGEEVRLYLLNNPELFGTINEQDCRKDFDLDEYVEEPKDYEYQIWLGDYYWDDENDNEIYLVDYINNNTIDIWKVIDTFEDFYFGDGVDYEVSTPWSHQDDSISLYNMNNESYEIIKDEAEDPHLFDDLIEELYNKYGNPNEEED